MGYQVKSGDYKRTWQGALAVLLLYLYKYIVVCATTMRLPHVCLPHVHLPCFYLMSITHPHVFSIRPPCRIHVPWRHTFNLRYTCAYHVYTMRNPCPLTSSLTLTPSRLLVLPDHSRLCHMTSRSRAYLHLL